jgi:hypothetical protein
MTAREVQRTGGRSSPKEEQMDQYEIRSDLESFARKKLDAERYPNDYHIFHLSKCQACGVVPAELTIEHHTGAKKGDFKGVITALCSNCGSTARIFSFTGSHREPLREETPACACGNQQFYVGECERMEGDEGLFGFFDEGVVVAKCSACGRKRVLVETD